MRKRALTDEQVAEARRQWDYNIKAWAVYRVNPARYAQPINLTIADLARQYRVSAGTMQNVIDRKGTYR